MSQDFNERRKQSYQGWYYSIQRIDILIVSISGAGVYVVLEALKFAFENKICCNRTYLKLAGILFIMAVIVNFISQFTGKTANDRDLKMCDEELSERGDKTEIERLDTEAEKYSQLTDAFNIVSLIFMIFGLASLMGYFLSIF